MTLVSRDDRWRSLAEQASHEMDDKKLTILVQQLCNALDESRKPHQSEHDQNNSTLLKRAG